MLIFKILRFLSFLYSVGKKNASFYLKSCQSYINVEMVSMGFII